MSKSDQTKDRRQTVKGLGRRPGFCLWTIRRPGESSFEPWRRGGWLALAFAALTAPAHAADAFSTDWAAGAKSETRLVAAGGSLAGFEVRLAPGAITYWRDPGDAGVPPVFDFAGSDNVARVEPVFPAPKRIRESDGSEAFGYDSDVVFPLKIEPSDPAKPVTLKLSANFAVCEKICLPAQARLRLTLPGAHSTYAASRRSGPRRRAARGRGEGVRRAHARRRRRLAPLRPRRSGPRARPLRRAARRLVGLGRGRAGRGGAGLLPAELTRQAEGRRASGRSAADNDGRGAVGGDDDAGASAEVGPRAHAHCAWLRSVAGGGPVAQFPAYREKNREFVVLFRFWTKVSASTCR